MKRYGLLLGILLTLTAALCMGQLVGPLHDWQFSFVSFINASPIEFEGATADAYETTITITDPTADRTFTVPNKTGQVMLSSASSALTPGVAVTLTVGLSNNYTDTPTDNEDQTITFSGAGTAGDVINVIFTTAGTADEVITFHATLVSSTGTLTCGTTAARYYVVTFISNGTHWFEVSRTAVQT